MDVRSGMSIWRILQPHIPATTPLDGDATCEVLVLGGGITGALVGYLLVQEGVDTLLIDRGEPAQGSTAASTGLLQYEVDTPLADLIKQVGQQKGVHAYRRGLVAIDEIEALVDQWADRCDFARRPSLYFASTRWHIRRLRQEADCRIEHGFPVEFWDGSQVAARSSLPAAGAIWSTGDAQIDPYRFTQQLLRQAQSRGLRIAARTEATQVTASANGVRVETKRGKIQARKIVFATGYEAHRQLGDQPANLCSTYAVASQPQRNFEGWPEGCLIWETARPYFYARQTADGRALIGGEDTAFSTDHESEALVERKSQRLRERCQQLFPAMVFDEACSWAGTFAETKDGLAFLGQHPRHPASYFALGYGGNGITFSIIAARLIADLYVGRPNPDAQVFGFDR